MSATWRALKSAGRRSSALRSENITTFPYAAGVPILHEEAVSHRADGIAAIRDLGVVRDENDRLAVLLGEPRHQIEDDSGVLYVQISRGFVRKDDRRLVGQRARDRRRAAVHRRKAACRGGGFFRRGRPRSRSDCARSSICGGVNRPSLRIGIITFSSAVNSSIRK